MRRYLVQYSTVPTHRDSFRGTLANLDEIGEAWARGDRRQALELVSDDEVRKISVVGTPEEVVARAREFHAAGIRPADPGRRCGRRTATTWGRLRRVEGVGTAPDRRPVSERVPAALLAVLLRGARGAQPDRDGADGHGCRTQGGHITDETIAYYRRRAEGGVGTITVEACLVSPDAHGSARSCRCTAASSCPGCSALVEALRPYDVPVGVQLMHPGRQTLLGEPVAPSPVPLNSRARRCRTR